MADRRELPEELLMNIMWRLKLSMGSHNAPRIENRVLTKTLFSCMLASRTLYRLAKPVLYHTINHKDLFTIAQHLAHEPALADHVRELSCPELLYRPIFSRRHQHLRIYHANCYLRSAGVHEDRHTGHA
jgi:hypothetical protein